MVDVMVFKEKHYDRYFVVDGIEDQNKVALKILRERYEMGYWYPTVETIEKRKKSDFLRLTGSYDSSVIDLSEDEVAGLPDGIRSSVERTRARYERGLKRLEKEYATDVLWINRLAELLEADPVDAVKMTITLPSGRKTELAKYLLDSRADHEYESYEVESAESY